MTGQIKAILFDSGRVINGPATGHWFIPPNFNRVVVLEKFQALDQQKLSAAFHQANTYISKQSWIRNEQEEYEHFLEFYRIFAERLPELGLTNETVNLLASDLVKNHKKYTFFADAVELIPRLSNFYKLAVVSDAWPSLNSVFRAAGLRDYFSSFIISSELGVSKPHERMYKKALEELSLLPHEAVFVDDNIRNCDGACELGIPSILLCRDQELLSQYELTVSKYPVVENLYGVMEMLETWNS